jgi:hypothetical protein
MSLLNIYQDGVSSYLRKDFPQAINYHQTLLKHYIFNYANRTSVDPLLYALDSILVLHSKVWIQLEHIFSSHRYQNQIQKQQKLLKAQGTLEGAEILLIYLKNRIGFTSSPDLRQGFKCLETIQRILKRKTKRYSLL